MKVSRLGLLIAMFLSGGMAIAQGTADDYRRAYALKEKFSAGKVFLFQRESAVDSGHSSVLVCAEYSGRTRVCIRECGQEGKEGIV